MANGLNLRAHTVHWLLDFTQQFLEHRLCVCDVAMCINYIKRTINFKAQFFHSHKQEALEMSDMTNTQAMISR